VARAERSDPPVRLELQFPGSRCEIVSGRGLLDRAGRWTRARIPGLSAAAVLFDRNTRPYARRVLASFGRAGIRAIPCATREGEASKTPAALAAMWEAFAKLGLDRRSAVVAVGGGALGDLAGFAAATYMRGVAAVLVPTTLLAQVDASIGGKTAVNLRAGKNLAGTFTQPRGVLIDPAPLRTLSERDYATGLAEVVKYGVIRDPALFARLESAADRVRRRDAAVLGRIVDRCVRIKASVVLRDERESRLRMVLNYGHTIGHALERATGYRLTHGEAVAVGMAAEARIAARLGLASPSFVERQDGLLLRLGLPVRARLPASARIRFFSALRLDKKSRAGEARFVLPEKPGRVRIGVAAPAWLISEILSETLSR
jgi:3-dehydroquinate synthase